MWCHISVSTGSFLFTGALSFPLYALLFFFFPLSSCNCQSRGIIIIIRALSQVILLRYWSWTSTGPSWNTPHLLHPPPSSCMLTEHAVSQDVGYSHAHVFTVWWVMIMMLYSSCSNFMTQPGEWNIKILVHLLPCSTTCYLWKSIPSLSFSFETIDLFLVIKSEERCKCSCI